MKKKGWCSLRIAVRMILAFAVFTCATAMPAIPKAPAVRAGLRSSPYGPQNGFPPPLYWLAAARSMAANFTHAEPALVWIIGTMETTDTGTSQKNYSGRVRLSFPAPGKAASDNIVFAEQDANEDHLKQFDQAGIQVWLQVEPANADIGTLIDLVLKRYAKHPCVIGFGIDVEWHRWSRKNSSGIGITDAQAEAWSKSVRAFNPNYQLFLKHWLESKMPPTCRQNLVFINDGQRFTSLARMLKDFECWGKAFAPAPVGFQIGYPDDRAWWQRLKNPASDIGKALLQRIPNTSDLIWVDFTMEEIWPPPSAAQKKE